MRWRLREIIEKKEEIRIRISQIVFKANSEWFFNTLFRRCIAQVITVSDFRDLKPANIMTKGNKLKIGDFGLSKKCNEHNKISKHTVEVGTPLYSSLQILKCECYSSKCDVWSLGVIYY